MKKTIFTVFLTSGLIIFASLSFAVPVEISYQGYLTDAGGVPVNGTTNITFKLYDNLDAVQWDSGAVMVDIANGVYSVILGAAPQPAIDPSIFSQDLWLGVTVKGDAEMTPKQKLTSVGFSIRAMTTDSVADGAVTNATITGPISSTKIEQGPGSTLDADTVDGKQATDLQNRVTGACGPGSSMTTVNADGSVVCTPAGLTGALANNYVPRSDGTGLVDSTIFDNGKVGIGTSAPSAKLDVFASPVDVYGNWTSYDAYYNPCQHCTDTCDSNDVAEYTCPDGQAGSCEDLRNSDGEYWQYRSVQCDQTQKAGAFVGNVDVGGVLSVTGDIQGSHIYGNGAGLTNVTATGINISCPDNYILQKTPAGWECMALPPVPSFCKNGDFVGCYEGAPVTRDVGACTGGVRTCSGGAYGACEGQVVPTDEACDALDNDCNGVVDDGQDGAVGCNQYYPDLDYDFFGDSSSSGICVCLRPSGYADNNSDCRDDNNQVNPNGVFHETSITVRAGQPVDWDWNCDGQWEKEYITVKDPGCHVELVPGGYECAGDGWNTSVPACGVTAAWTDCLFESAPYQNCHAVPGTRTQACR